MAIQYTVEKYPPYKRLVEEGTCLNVTSKFKIYCRLLSLIYHSFTLCSPFSSYMRSTVPSILPLHAVEFVSISSGPESNQV